ncbi:MAG: methyl-accepting chemotaxis protein [Clostridia bacterium]|nr:methyl-accepting chemotaxis protein [Clostridia bacterium]
MSKLSIKTYTGKPRGSIKKKILSSFIFTVLIMGCTSFYPLVSYNQPIQKYDSILENITLANNIISLCQEYTEICKKLILDVKNSKLRNEYNQKKDSILTSFNKLKNGLSAEESLNAQSGLENLINTFIENCEKATSTSEATTISVRVETMDYVKKVNGFIDSNFKTLISSEIEYSKIVREELAKTTKTILTVTVLILAVVLTFCIIIALMITNRISKPLKNISQQADKVASGDLTVDEIVLKTKDELEVLGASFNKMVSNLKAMISKVNESSSHVLQVSDLLYQSATHSSAASEQISSSIQGIAEGSQNQAKLSEETAKTIDGMYNIVKLIADKSYDVKESSDEAQKVTSEGNKSIEEVIKQISSLNSTITESTRISEELHNKSTEIGQIVDVITSISEQTNLLSLNAAIEAARAGDQGKGFAVVADEVRKLAEQSSTAARRITSIIKSIQEETAKMSGSMNRSMIEIQFGIKVTSNAGEAFKKISSTIGRVNDQINEIYSEIKKMNDCILDIKHAGDNIVEITKASATSSQEVAAAVQELSAGMEEVLSTTHVLNNMATDLKELVNGFKL